MKMVLLALASLAMALAGSGDAVADAAPGSALTGKVRITKGALRLNKVSGLHEAKVAVLNNTRPKQALYGPLTLAVSHISRPDVSLDTGAGATPSGQDGVRVALPDAGLAARKSISTLLRFANPAHKRFSYALSAYGYLTPNHAPSLTAAQALQAITANAFSFKPETGDADDDALVFTLSDAPAGMTIDADTGAVSWTPTPDQVGEASFTITATDSRGAVVARTFSVLVAAPADKTAPSIPADLSANVVAGQVALSWTASTDNVSVTGYRIFRDGSPVATTASTAYLDTTVAILQSYQYSVRALDAAGNSSGPSASVTAAIPDGAGNHAPSFLGVGGDYVAASNAVMGTVLGEIRAVDADTGDILSYRLVSGSGLAIDSTSGELRMDGPLSVDDGAVRTITVEVSDGKTPVQRQFRVVLSNAVLLSQPGITRQYWGKLGGDHVSALTADPRYPDGPDTVEVLNSAASPVNVGDNYGQRLVGYLRAQQTGRHTFYLASDDDSELWLSANTDPANLSSTPLASVTGWTNVNQWNRYSSQKSIGVDLVRGQVYYLQVLHKEGGGGDHVELAWQGPGANTPTVIDGSSLLPLAALDSVPPTAPEPLALTRVNTQGVTIAWSTSHDNSSIAGYRLIRDGTVVASVGANIRNHTDPGVVGTHDYAVVAVDAFGNVSPPAELKAVDASQMMDAVEAAVVSGDPAAVIDPLSLIDAALAEIAERQTETSAFLNGFYPIEGITYDPGYNSQWPTPNGDNESIVTLLPGNKGYPLAIAGIARNARFAAFGSNAPNLFQNGANLGYQDAFTRVLAWLLTGTPQSTGNLAGKHTAALVFANSTTNTRNWLTTQNFGGQANQWTVTNCATTSTVATCIAGQELLILGRSANDTDAQAIADAIATAMTNGVPVLYLHDNWATNALSEKLSALMGFSLPYAGNYFTSDAANWADSTALSAALDQARGYPQLTALLTHFKQGDWSIDLTACSGGGCTAAESSSLQADFYAGARDVLRTRLNHLEMSGLDLFAAPGLRLNKLLVLLGDVFRREIAYPMDKLTTDMDRFMRAYYADHAVYDARNVNPAQPDLGSFSKPTLANVPLFSKTVSAVTRTADHFTAAGVYAVPGQRFTVQRLDNQAGQVLKVAINSLRSGSTHEFDADSYNRPKYLQSPWVELKPGASITLTSPYGGPIQIWLQGASSPVTTEVSFTDIGLHPVWNGTATTQAFKTALAQGDYDWAEFITPGFQIHSTRALMEETLADPKWNTPEVLSEAIWKYFYQSIFNLAGFTGDGLALNATVTAKCYAMGWDCTSPAIHGMFTVTHFNADQATCGYGCSGNPYDAFWAYGPLNWGDAHEVGHNLQRGRLKIDGSASTEVSNNIFPTHTVYSWNKDHSTAPLQAGHENDQASIFNALSAARLTADPAGSAHAAIWVNGDVFARLEFYRQLAWQAYDLPGFGEGGWDIYTLLYLQERLFTTALGSDAAWSAQKDALGFGSYDKTTASNISGNDFMLIATSFLTGLDQRPFFDLWGVTYSATAASQVAGFGYAPAEQRFSTLRHDANGYWSSLDPTGSVLVDGVSALP